MKQYILDGHNILLTNSEMRAIFRTDSARAMNSLILFCQRLTAAKNTVCSIFFDGDPPGEIVSNIKNVHVTFSYRTTADTLIKSLIARSQNPRNLIVVSDDTAVRSYARTYSCTVISATDFLKRNAPTQRPDELEKRSADDLSIEDWLRLFKR